MCAAAKGFQLNALLRRACLGVISDLGRVPVQDHLPPAGTLSAPRHADPRTLMPCQPPAAEGDGVSGRGEQWCACAGKEEAPGSQQELTPECACLVTCMLLRAAYGGLGGDVAMMKQFAVLWAARCAPGLQK